ncbi:unnamed protein product, partial [marine sediment metagenome]
NGGTKDSITFLAIFSPSFTLDPPIKNAVGALGLRENIHKISDLKGEKVVIYGAGPVARIAAILAAKEGLNTFLVETWDKSNEEFIKNLAKEVT